MKNKVFGRVLSAIIALAVVAVSLFAAIPAINLDASAATVEDTWDGTKVQPTKTDADGNILIETAEELAWVALEGSTEETKDKNYKVVDGAVFNLNGFTGVTPESTASEVNDATPTDKKWENSAKTFAGNFDGNGLIVYNMYAPGSAGGAHGGLFPWIIVNNTADTCNFSNVTIKASYIKGYHYAAALIGNADALKVGVNVNITNCKVENCFIRSTDSNSACSRTGALLVGSAAHNKVTVDGCVAINNVINATDIKGGFVGNTSLYAADNIFKNSVVIGSTPYPTLQTGSTKALNAQVTKASCYSNIYTDQDIASNYKGYITTVATSDMKGSAAKANMPALDWSKLIAFDDEYPEIRVTHTLTTVSNGKSGHSTSCSDCGKILVETHNLVDYMEELLSKCDCGYTTPITQLKDSWDGSLATGFASGSGTQDDPYIIATAEQMAYLALSTTLDSSGKYFKVKDNTIFNMNGAIGITADSTAAEVKSAPKNGAYKWDSDGSVFNGNFDGNGVIIYNVYSSKTGYGGLFPRINTNNAEKSVTIKNVAVKASCFAGYHGAGGIVGNANALTTSQFLIFENCMVQNCYITDMGDTNPDCKRTTGIIAGLVEHNGVTVDNCLAKGNILDSINIVGGFIGNTSAYSPDAIIKNSVSLGTLPYPTQKSGSSVDLQEKVSKATCYSNVYTDQNVSDKYAAKQVQSLTKEQMSGDAGLYNLTLDFDKIWFANEGTPELQLFHNLKGVAYDVDPYLGHNADCDICGIKGITVSTHIYDATYTCTACGFVCDHQYEQNLTITETKDGDCVTAPNTKTECSCGYVDVKYHSEAEGHKLVKIDAKEPTCNENGNIEYWTCETCNKIFLSDDKMAAMDTAVTEEDVIIYATKEHLPLLDSKGNPVFGMNAQKHWMICKFCNREIEKTSHEVETNTESAGGHSSKCVVCLYEVHDYADVNEKGKPVQQYDETAHWYNCEECGKAEYAEHTLETDENVEGIYQWCEDAEGNSCGYEIFKYSLTSDDGQVSVVGTDNVYTKDVITDIFKITAESPSYEKVKEIFDSNGHKGFTAYEFSPTQEMAEGGSVTLKINAGDLYGDAATIYYVDVENGTIEKMKTQVDSVKEDEDDKDEMLVATTSITKAGFYAVGVDMTADADGDNTPDNEDINGDKSPISPETKTQNVASAAVVAVLSAAAIVFARKIKNI